MISLKDFIGQGATPTRQENVWIKQFVFIKIGSGYFTVITDEQMSFEGQVSFLGIKRNFSLFIALKDDSTCATKIEALDYDGEDEQATYHVNSKGILVIQANYFGRSYTVTAKQKGSETRLTLSGKVKYKIKLVPKG